MRIIRRTYRAGETLVTREYPKRKIEKGAKRQPKTNPTTEQVWANNLRYAIFDLTLILNHNFTAGDWHLQYTYEEEPSLEQAATFKQKMLDKLRYECRKAGIKNYKWVMTTEYVGQRIHHHMIITRIPKEIIKRCWPHGHVFFGPLWESPNRKQLASYLLKQASKLYQSENKIFKRRYNCSRNISIPEPMEEEIERADIAAEPKPEEGYYIDGDVEEYEHAITRLPCREYVQVSETKDTNVKWYKGIRVKHETINFTKLLREAYREEQLSMDELMFDMGGIK